MALIFVLLLNRPAEKVIQSLSESRKTIFLLVSVIVQVKINASFSQNSLKAHWDSHLSPGQPDSLASHTCLRSGHFSPSQMLLLKSEVRLISSGLYNLLTDAVTPPHPPPLPPASPAAVLRSDDLVTAELRVSPHPDSEPPLAPQLLLQIFPPRLLRSPWGPTPVPSASSCPPPGSAARGSVCLEPPLCGRDNWLLPHGLSPRSLPSREHEGDKLQVHLGTSDKPREHSPFLADCDVSVSGCDLTQ